MKKLIYLEDAIDAFYSYPNIDWTTIDVMKKLNALPSAQQWIPVSKELPALGEDVLVTDGCYYYVYERTTNDESSDAFWCDSEGWYYEKDVVLAWMPLPEGYRDELLR